MNSRTTTLSALRDYNKIHLVCKSAAGGGAKPGMLSSSASHNSDNLYTYDAYLLNELSIPYSAKFSDILSGFSVANDAAFIINVLTGMSPYFSMERIYSFMGVEPLKLQLSTMLKLKTSFQKDIADPIMQLYNMAVPATTNDEKLSQLPTTFANRAAALSSQNHSEGNNIKAVLYKLGEMCMYGAQGIMDLLMNNEDIKTVFDNTYALETPPMMKNPVALYYGKDSEKNAIFGPLMPCFIQSINLSLGKPMIAGGKPDSVKVEIGLEYGRTVERSTFNALFPSNLNEVKLYGERQPIQSEITTADVNVNPDLSL